MGVCDFFKGDCPHCGDQVENYKGEPSGDIQTKMFKPWAESGCCFREFRPGSRVPFAPHKTRVSIGSTACCNKPVVAVFEGDVLVRYEKDIGG